MWISTPAWQGRGNLPVPQASRHPGFVSLLAPAGRRMRRIVWAARRADPERPATHPDDSEGFNLGFADALRRRLEPATWPGGDFRPTTPSACATHAPPGRRGNAPTGATYFFFAGFFFAAVFLAAGFLAADFVFALEAAFFAMLSSVSGMAMSKQCTCECESLMHWCDSYRTK